MNKDEFIAVLREKFCPDINWNSRAAKGLAKGSIYPEAVLATVSEDGSIVPTPNFVLLPEVAAELAPTADECILTIEDDTVELVVCKRSKATADHPMMCALNGYQVYLTPFGQTCLLKMIQSARVAAPEILCDSVHQIFCFLFKGIEAPLPQLDAAQCAFLLCEYFPTMIRFTPESVRSRIRCIEEELAVLRALEEALDAFS